MMDKIKAYGICLYKVENKKIKILLCKSVQSRDRWGCLKGLQTNNESGKQCAKREFLEESSIPVDMTLFENYFEQINEEKDIGIWLVNAKNVPGIMKYFFEDRLYDTYLSWENSKVKFFFIDELPIIKKKQKKLVNEIIDFLRNKSQSH